MKQLLSFLRSESVDPLDAIPFYASLTILGLYGLAFVRGLTLLVPVLFLLLCLLQIRKRLIDPQLLLAIGLMCAAAILASGRVVVWWDDLNFWANDAKYLWFMRGFAGKYGNVSPEFGDYPPVTALWKWIFLSLSPREYREGLQFSAYHVLNMIYLLPLLKSTRRFPSLIARLLAVPAVFLIPGIVCALQFTGSAADITMGTVYGALLIAMAEHPAAAPSGKALTGEEVFRLLRIALYTGVLLLTKNTGFEWAFFALLFWLLVCGKRETLRSVLPTVLVPGAFWGSWLLFCLTHRRVAKLTGEGIRMASGGFVLPERAGEKFAVFLRSFFLYPLHEEKTWVIDLSAGALFLIIIITTVIITMPGRSVPDRDPHAPALRRVPLILFLLLSGIAAYGAIMITHLSIFRVEEQYFDPFDMTRSISRYAAPYTISAIALLLHLIAEGAPDAGRRSGDAGQPGAGNAFRRSLFSVAVPFLLFPLLTACYPGEARAFLTWRETRARDLAVREETVGEDGRAFLSWAGEHEDLWGRGRVLFLRDPGTNHWVRDTYIGYAACPLAVVYAEAEPDGIDRLRDEMHAAIVYDGALTSTDGAGTASETAE